jgi:hypothetical protein
MNMENNDITLNESYENLAEGVYFIKFLPDDYHGAPKLSSICPPDQFPSVPDYYEVLQAWCSAGYNAYAYRDEDDDYDEEQDEDDDLEERYFNDYGNMGMYYAIYMISIDGRPRIMNNIIELLDSLSEYGSVKVGVDKFIEMARDIEGVNVILPIIRKDQNMNK